MEESVWLYFGVLVVIITIGIIASIFVHFQDDSEQQSFFDAIKHLGAQAQVVCNAPKDTMLSIRIDVPAGAVLYTTQDKVCGTFSNQTRCAAADCPLVEKNLLDLTDTKIFTTHAYTCTVLNAERLNITCAG